MGNKCYLTFVLTVVILLYFEVPAFADFPNITIVRPTENRNVCSEKEVQEFVDLIEKRIKDLIAIGVDPNIFADLEIKIVPSLEIVKRHEVNGEIYADSYAGVASTEYVYTSSEPEYQYVPRNVIKLTIDATEHTFYHELGHTLEVKKLGKGDINYGWDTVNEFGEKYIKIKNYDNIQLSYLEQQELPWEERLSEWFAEDVRQYFIEKIAELESRKLPPKDSSFGIYRGVGPEKTKVVDGYLKKLLFSGYGAY